MIDWITEQIDHHAKRRAKKKPGTGPLHHTVWRKLILKEAKAKND